MGLELEDVRTNIEFWSKMRIYVDSHIFLYRKNDEVCDIFIKTANDIPHCDMMFKNWIIQF